MTYCQLLDNAIPITSVLPVEVLSAEFNQSRPKPLNLHKQRSEIRQQTLEAVRKHGGHAAGEQETGREYVYRLVLSLPWQLLMLLTAFVDIIMLFVEISVPSARNAVDAITAIVLFTFVIDLVLRIFAYRRILLRLPMFWFDFAVVTVSIVFFLVGLAAASSVNAAAAAPTAAARGARAVIGIVTAARAVRAARFAAKVLQVSTGASTSARRVTGENKQRFVDLEASFDLDLAYVLPNLIAMSVPATGFTALYRNPVHEVIRFFETRHGPMGYTIINLCPELPYDASGFVSGEVLCFDIQDHTPPTMAQFVEFINLCGPKMGDPAVARRLLAVHCRGGKGRTGSMCCAWLLYSRTCVDADDALTLFALERTDLRVGKRKIQGVDTPSQRRYIHQVDMLLRAQSAYLPTVGESTAGGREREAAAMFGGDLAAPAVPQPEVGWSASSAHVEEICVVRPPACPVLRLTSLELAGWVKPPKGALVCAVHLERQVIMWSSPLRIAAPQPAAAAPVAFDLRGTEVSGDVRVSVFELEPLLREREKRRKKGIDARLPFDAAPSGPWGDDAVERGGGSEKEDAGGSDTAKRVIAGKETGCKFFMLFHTGFVSEGGSLPVPLQMMDKAFKNKHDQYHPDGIATLRFELLGDGHAV